MPGEVLYPVKRTHERFLLLIVRPSDERARLHARLVERRGAEMAAMADAERNGPELEQVSSHLESHVQRAVILVGGPPRLSPPRPPIPPPLRTREARIHRELHALFLREMLAHRLAMQRVMAEMQDPRREHFHSAFERSQVHLAHALEILEILAAEHAEPRDR